jgi:hypothetical protein
MKELDIYKKTRKEYYEALKVLEDKLKTHPVRSVTVVSSNNIVLTTKDYTADVYLDRPREEVKIRKVCRDNDFPISEEKIAEFVKELNTEKKEFEEYLDNLFKTL